MFMKTVMKVTIFSTNNNQPPQPGGAGADYFFISRGVFMLGYFVNYVGLFLETSYFDGFFSVSCVCAVVLVVRFLFSSKVVFE